MSTTNSLYWQDLADDLEDPEFLRHFVLESIRINTVDSLINQIEDARVNAGLSKAALARVISTEPAVVRRLLGHATRSNPTVGTVSELAAALGYRLTLEPIPSTAHQIPTALRSGSTSDTKALAEAVEGLA